MEPKIVIPIFGMLIGNSLNGVVLGIDRFQSELQHHQQLFMSDLSLGSLSPLYASKKYIQLSLRAAMTPILNAMSIVGIVSIPGNDDGQLLAVRIQLKRLSINCLFWLRLWVQSLLVQFVACSLVVETNNAE